MGKTAKLKKTKCTKSLHSRAAKRASSPTLNVDKSITSITLPLERPSVLGVHHAAGVTKRKAKGKALSRQQRLRHERGAEKAEAVMEKREKKVERSVGKKRAGQERNAAWEDLNGRATGRGKSRKKAATKASDEDEWEDENMGDIGETTDHEAAQDKNKELVVDEADEEIL